MSEPTPPYHVRARTNRQAAGTQPCNDLPLKAHKLALRLLQLAQEPGEYDFTLIVAEDGRWQLKPPPEVEELGL